MSAPTARRATLSRGRRRQTQAEALGPLGRVPVSIFPIASQAIFPALATTLKALVSNGFPACSWMTSYQAIHIMEGGVERGTAQKLKVLQRPIAGKTGSTNDEKDAWFIGFTPDLAVGVYMGFDNPAPLGHCETGGNDSAPVGTRFLQTRFGRSASHPVPRAFGHQTCASRILEDRPAHRAKRRQSNFGGFQTQRRASG